MKKDKNIIFLNNPSILPWKKSLEYEFINPELFDLGFTKINQIIEDLEILDKRISPYRITCECSKYLVDIVLADIKNLNSNFKKNFEKKILFTGIINIYKGGKLSGTSYFGHNPIFYGQIKTIKDNSKEFISEKGLSNLIFGVEQEPIKRIEKILKGFQLQKENRFNKTQIIDENKNKNKNSIIDGFEHMHSLKS